MKILVIITAILCTSIQAMATSDFTGSPLDRFLSRNSPEELQWVKQDLKNILETAQLEEGFIQLEKQPSSEVENLASIECIDSKVVIKVSATEAEWSSTFYKALQKMGFLFPHAKRQVSPSKEKILSHCKQVITWQPRFPVRGFHIHNMHPNEWVDSLYISGNDLMIDYLRWLKRNQQNLIQIQKIKVDKSRFTNQLSQVLEEAYKAKIISSLSVSFSLYQQKGFALLPWYSAIFGWGDEHYIRKGINQLRDNYKFEILTFELGTTEFTSAPYEKTLNWIEVARKELARKDQMIFNKIHVSSGQQKEPYGNFNFLPQFADTTVGVLPHTVMAYSLKDEVAPVYGLDNFNEMRNYLVEQSKKRPTIYYPETSYYCSMDIDLPLFLTDYLVTRSEDMDFIEKHGTWGQVNFTTGQEMGYWMMDWTVALLADKEYAGQPFIGAKLLGEDASVWNEIASFQTKHFRKNQLIQYLSFSNLQDELNILGKEFFVHFRTLLRDYFQNPTAKALQNEIAKLKMAIKELPDTSKIKSEELRLLVDVTFERLNHALFLRKHLANLKPENKIPYLLQAKQAREKAKTLMDHYKENYFEKSSGLAGQCLDNPTSYDCGYGWTAMSLYHWEREEEMVEKRIYNPFYKNFYSVLRILL